MATMVCQGMQSCYEPSQLIEPITTLRLKLSSPIKPQISISQSIELSLQKQYDYDSSNCRSFVQSLSNNTKNETVMAPYVHPLSKSTIMSEKSLELCTESLGSETGTSDVIEGNNIFLSNEQHKSACLLRKKVSIRSNSSRNFPPPLKSMSVSNSIQVRSYREDGRLIINAIETPSRTNNFHVERSHGRLKLSIIKDSDYDSYGEENAEENDIDYQEEKDGPKSDETAVEEDDGGKENRNPMKCIEERNSYIDTILARRVYTKGLEPCWVAT